MADFIKKNNTRIKINRSKYKKKIVRLLNQYSSQHIYISITFRFFLSETMYHLLSPAHQQSAKRTSICNYQAIGPMSHFLMCDCEMNQWTDWPRRPTPFVVQSSPWRLPWRDVRTTMCCISRHVRYGLEIEEQAEGKTSSSCVRQNGKIICQLAWISSFHRIAITALCHTVPDR